MASFVSGERKKQDGGRTNERRQPVNDEETTDESALSLLLERNIVECALVYAVAILSFSVDLQWNFIMELTLSGPRIFWVFKSFYKTFLENNKNL